MPVTESLLAHIIVSKFDDRQPLYHLEKQFSSRYGIHVSRQSLSRWVVDTAKPLMPLLNKLKDSIIDHDIASMDATTLQVLNEPGRNPTTKSYAYCFRGRRGQWKRMRFPDERLATDGKAGVTEEEPSIARDGRLWY